MTKKPAVDGFIPRRSPGTLGEHHFATADHRPVRPTLRPSSSTAETPRRHRAALATAPAAAPVRKAHQQDAPALQRSSQGLTRIDVDESLRQIDATPDHQTPKVGKRGGFKSKRRKSIKIVIIVLILAVLAVTGWVAVRALIASNSVFKGDLFGLVQQKELKADANGRSNILVFGTSEDDQEGDHPGALLTDSIMMLSVDQKKNDAFMVSIPRDLWVKYGEACSAGYEGKINALYDCYSDAGSQPAAGAQALAQKVSEVTGYDIQYQVHVNYTVVRQAVDAVGGIDVKIETSNPNGILDRNFDWKCNYQCYYVKYKNGEVARMDGEHALAFMRARNAQGGYGLERGNFDREQNQQKVILALKDKALGVGTLSNPGKVTALMSALGDNLKTNIETSEIRTVMTLASEIQGDAISSIDLADGEKAVLTTGNVSGQSSVYPMLSIYDYSGIEAYIRKNTSVDPVMKEAAQVVVLNGSGIPGVAQAEADRLTELGVEIPIGSVANAPQGDYVANIIYQVGDAKPATAKKLTELYGVAPVTSLPTNLTIDPGVNFVIIVVDPPAPPSQNE